MFYAHNRQGIVDNPAFLLRYLQQYFPDHYELLWITTAPDSCTPLPNVKIVGRRSLQYFRYYIRTKIYISNDMIDEWLIKKKGQIYLTTWHGGGAYKQIGKQVCSEDSEFIKNYDKLYNRL
ncbi:MAG: CDP-glycerol glycerophosphotransferase family protein, partial [Lachnospiraceae bacterium]|nr:CDP-glycerol glycerophosphotransferase family protein [Lachnospiraceae bacterium]